MLIVIISLMLQLTPMNLAEAQEPSQWVAEVWSPAEHEGPVQTFLSSLKVSLQVDLSHSVIAAGSCVSGSLPVKAALVIAALMVHETVCCHVEEQSFL